MVGTVLEDRYRVLSKLGEGGMGEVYLVEHLNLRRQEALKILHPSLASTPQFVLRFRREARATNRLQHPNIVCVYDFGQLADGRFYLTTEFVDGLQLDKLLHKGPLAPSRVLRVLAQLAEAIDHAHQQGVIHRDLKPENMILVERRGHADILKVLDFGVAKIISPEYKESLQLTNKDEVSGTPQYMSPEQLRGDGVDPRMDIYAAGCIAYELLVGDVPFTGTTMEIVYKHLRDQPVPPSQRKPDAQIPPELDAVILRCLEKDPVKRFQTGKDLLAAVERVPGYSAHRPGSGRRTAAIMRPNLAEIAAAQAVVATTIVDRKGASTEPVHAFTDDDALRHYWAALRRVAEGLLDQGHGDVQLIIGLTTFRSLLDDLARCDYELQLVETRSFDLEQAARERESSFRFALGELRFAHIEALGQPMPALDAQIAEYEQKISQTAQDLEIDLTLTTEQAINLTARRATLEEEVTQIARAMAKLVDEGIPRYVEPLKVHTERLLKAERAVSRHRR